MVAFLKIKTYLKELYTGLYKDFINSVDYISFNLDVFTFQFSPHFRLRGSSENSTS